MKISTDRILEWLSPLARLGQNSITLAGTALTTSAALTMIGFWIVEVFVQRNPHPYAGLLVFLALPALFVLGLLLIPVGILWERRRARREGAPATPPDPGESRSFRQRALTWIGLATLANVVILSAATYESVVYMESQQFCGMTCHSVMAPEYTAYLRSPHAHVACIDCHVGPGAGWFVRSKLAGTRQLVALSLGTYSRPIPAPVKDLRPSRDTCEECHWPQKFHGDKLVVRTKYDSDEASTPLTTVLVLRIGGRDGTRSQGIHGLHLDPPDRISYVAADERRQIIPLVTYRNDAGQTIEFSAPAASAPPPTGERRTMDCLDCHNRPSHTFELPERAIDKAIARGGISRELPFVKKKSVELLRAEYPDREAAARRIAQGLSDYYHEAYPDIHRKQRTQIEAAAAELVAIYEGNVFPGMKVTWGTYPNNIGHEDSVGCFRCHDDLHKSGTGQAISQDCDACHAVLAMDEKDPKILAELSMK